MRGQATILGWTSCCPIARSSPSGCCVSPRAARSLSLPRRGSWTTYSIYLRGFYFALSHLCLIVFGDIPPTTPTEVTAWTRLFLARGWCCSRARGSAQTVFVFLLLTLRTLRRPPVRPLALRTVTYLSPTCSGNSVRRVGARSLLRNDGASQPPGGAAPLLAPPAPPPLPP